MDGATDLALGEDPVDESMLLDAADSGECIGDDMRREMYVVIALDIGARARDPGLDSRLDLVWGGHPHTG